MEGLEETEALEDKEETEAMEDKEETEDMKVKADMAALASEEEVCLPITTSAQAVISMSAEASQVAILLREPTLQPIWALIFTFQAT